MSAKVALHTLGCKLNFSETSAIGSQFLEHGFHLVGFNEKADIYLFNTCTVTENAEKECRQLVRRALRQNPDSYIIITGCYAQLRPEEIAGIEGVDAVLGTNEKFRLFSLLQDFEKKPGLSCVFVSPPEELNQFGAAHSTEPGITGRTRAFFKIQDGCDYKCSFCTIPLARGASRSMNSETAVNEFRNLIAAGYKGVVITGVNVGDYGKTQETNLFSLLAKMVSAEGNFRIRISSIEPNLLSDEIINLAAENEKLCSHFHIPLQSGSPKILKLMKRRYKSSYYSDLIYRIKDKIPDAAIGVDVITGFPGEAESEFMETYNFILGLPVSYLHVFTYSERPDTPAVKLPGTVDPQERRKRTNMLRILSDKKKNEFYTSMTGRNLEVLFESEVANGMIKGYSSNYVKVQHLYEEGLENEFTRVKIISSEGNYCAGKKEEIKNSVALFVS